MTELFLTVLEISASVSLIILLLLLISPLLNRRYAAKWQYLIWIFLAVRLLIPWNGADGKSVADIFVQWKNRIVSEQEQDMAVLPAENAPRRVVVEIPAQMTEPLAVQAEKKITLLDIGALVWMAGSVIFIAVHLISYAYYKKQVRKYGTVVKDTFVLREFPKVRTPLQATKHEISRHSSNLQDSQRLIAGTAIGALFAEVKQELHIRKSLPVIEFSGAASPMIMGFFKPVLILPENDYSNEELYFILKHELVHLKRGDVCMKFLFMLANAVHWFNPFVWILQREAAVDMELSCDERVTQGAGYAEKKAYTETLLSTLHKGCKRKTVLSTGFYGGKQVMKRRFRNILQKTGKKNGFIILACAAVLTVSAGTLVGCSMGKGTDENISDEQAEAAGTEQNPSEVTLTGRMAGNWRIDFDRTDAALWGTGISYGDSMEISGMGAFSYYIGIGVGGTGQCEEADGGFRVEIEPYEEHSAGQEVLTLEYVNEYGAEYILMDWYGEDVYWVRDMSGGGEVAGVDSAGGSNTAGGAIILSVIKDGEVLEKQASMVVESSYVLYLPDGEWQKEEADMWRAVSNEDVRIYVAHFEDDYPVERLLTNDGYAPENLSTDDGFAMEGMAMAKQENGIQYRVKLHKAEEDVWCVFYSYPATEDWENELTVITDTFAILLPNEHITTTSGVSAQILGYVTDIGGNTVTIDRQDWVTSESEDWKPEYDQDAGFQIVDIEGEDITYPVRSDCRYFILENHQGESIEIDKEAFAQYIEETDFPIFWSVDVEDGEAVSFAEWYRP